MTFYSITIQMNQTVSLTTTPLVCNAEGKRLHLPMNRPLQHDDGYVYNVVRGTAFICGYGKEDCTSVPDQLIKKYMKMYKIPPVFPTDDTGVFLCI